MLKANGQAEANNKSKIKLIKKKIEEHPRRWHEVLSEALWAYRVSKNGAIQVTPFLLVFGQEVVLPVEVNLQACRVAKQNALSAKEYGELMIDKIDEMSESRFKAMSRIEEEKIRSAKVCNKRVKEKSFQIDDLVWKTILPLGTWNNKFGKWSLSWEGSYKIVGIVLGNPYFVEALEGQRMAKALNGKCLKKYYYPSVWQGA
jgi:hypothetical protein